MERYVSDRRDRRQASRARWQLAQWCRASAALLMLSIGLLLDVETVVNMGLALGIATVLIQAPLLLGGRRWPWTSASNASGRESPDDGLDEHDGT